ncbi:NTP transferase domain-containing protein [uncultured Muriicola sp.]|uniref:NTP transferase domain-containing protein n=1 Tax=uncultured Muriicola sp. TaxID=1583102 RepID=UPI0026066592|nr:NTP transferase domain-containing protein [uncultured Muriicola sp.]
MTQISSNPNSSIAPLYGLILSGGKSSRMGTDKALIDYHGRPQQELLFELVQKFCEHTFISLREDQQDDLLEKFKVIVDLNEYAGPLNGILSAHKKYPEAAWLVIACDLPLLNKETLQLLVKGRDASKEATALATRASGLPEPLAAIWEPKGLQHVKEYLINATSSCPRKFLINTDTHLIFPENDDVLSNANSMQDYRRIKDVLNS